mmetsp:Transcript_108135/g.312472  ORF Transcript_108135/g.312472 Transcript_108135/m.312472 type:complete len:287 (+) Transcript_108135:121-981(+)
MHHAHALYIKAMHHARAPAEHQPSRLLSASHLQPNCDGTSADAVSSGFHFADYIPYEIALPRAVWLHSCARRTTFLCPPKAPLRDVPACKIALGALLVHQNDSALLQIIPDLVGLLEIRSLPRLVPLLNELFDLLIAGRVRRPLTAREVGHRRRGERRSVGRTEKTRPLLGHLHRELRHRTPFLQAEGLVIGMHFLELRLGILDSLVKRLLLAARDTQREWFVRLMRATDTLSTKTRLPTMFLELRVLPDLPGDLDDTAAHAELALVLDAHLELARVLLGTATRRR